MIPILSDGAWSLGSYAARIEERLQSWDVNGASARAWRRDPSFWPAAAASSVANGLGWLDLPRTMPDRVAELSQLAHDARAEGFTRAVILGMGGSSLAPDVFARTFPPTDRSLRVSILDSTHPEAVQRVRTEGNLAQTVFVVSSKSGTTLEPNSFFRYFWSEIARTGADPARQFIALTDPGTPLESLAHEHRFRACFSTPKDVGGRYSALTIFGLLPAVLAGVDVRELLARAQRMADASSADVPATRNPALALGAALGELTLAGRDKVTFVASPSVAAFPDWAEQLIAESTGKDGRGIIPVAGEIRPLDPIAAEDRVVIHLTRRGEAEAGFDGAAALLADAGVPVLRFELETLEDLGSEFFRWELAVAAAGSVIGIDPFNQPDVELAKQLARDAMDRPASPGAPAAPGRISVGASPEFRDALARWVGSARRREYVAIQAYLAPSGATTDALHRLRESLRTRLGISTTLGYGPRFLHSTGQLHKGGPPTGLFLQITDRPTTDLAVPETTYTFARILRAQAEGDATALRQKGRRLLAVDIGSDVLSGLRTLTDAFHA